MREKIFQLIKELKEKNAKKRSENLVKAIRFLSAAMGCFSGEEKSDEEKALEKGNQNHLKPCEPPIEEPVTEPQTEPETETETGSSEAAEETTQEAGPQSGIHEGGE